MILHFSVKVVQQHFKRHVFVIFFLHLRLFMLGNWRSIKVKLFHFRLGLFPGVSLQYKILRDKDEVFTATGINEHVQ